jgi:predicted transcriptional regulator
MAHKPTENSRAQVSALISYGVTQEEICYFLKITDKTLRKHYARELKTGALVANSAAARKLYQKGVVEGDTTCLIFWLKTKAGWRDSGQKEAAEQQSEILKELLTLKAELNEKYKRDY